MRIRSSPCGSVSLQQRRFDVVCRQLPDSVQLMKADHFFTRPFIEDSEILQREEIAHAVITCGIAVKFSRRVWRAQTVPHVIERCHRRLGSHCFTIGGIGVGEDTRIICCGHLSMQARHGGIGYLRLLAYPTNENERPNDETYDQSRRTGPNPGWDRLKNSRWRWRQDKGAYRLLGYLP